MADMKTTREEMKQWKWAIDIDASDASFIKSHAQYVARLQNTHITACSVFLPFKDQFNRVVNGMQEVMHRMIKEEFDKKTLEEKIAILKNPAVYEHKNNHILSMAGERGCIDSAYVWDIIEKACKTINDCHLYQTLATQNFLERIVTAPDYKSSDRLAKIMDNRYVSWSLDTTLDILSRDTTGIAFADYARHTHITNVLNLLLHVSISESNTVKTIGLFRNNPDNAVNAVLYPAFEYEPYDSYADVQKRLNCLNDAFDRIRYTLDLRQKNATADRSSWNSVAGMQQALGRASGKLSVAPEETTAKPQSSSRTRNLLQHLGFGS